MRVDFWRLLGGWGFRGIMNFSLIHLSQYNHLALDFLNIYSHIEILARLDDDAMTDLKPMDL